MSIKLWLTFFGMAVLAYRLLNAFGIDRVSDSAIKRAKRQTRREYSRLRPRLEALDYATGLQTLNRFDAVHEQLLATLSDRFAGRADDLGSDRYRAIGESVRAGLVSSLTRQCLLIERGDAGSASIESHLETMQRADADALASLEVVCLDVNALDVEQPDSWSHVEASISKAEQLVGEAHAMSARAFSSLSRESGATP